MWLVLRVQGVPRPVPWGLLHPIPLRGPQSQQSLWTPLVFSSEPYFDKNKKRFGA